MYSTTLSLSASPKVVPKTEVTEPTELSQTPVTTPAIPKTLNPIPPPPARSTNPHLRPNLADERRRLRHFYHSVAAAKRQHANTNANPSPPSSALALVVSNGGGGSKRKKSQPRSSDLQRVTAIPADEADRARDLVRRARILYESIRTCLLRDEVRSQGPDGKRSRADLVAGMKMRDAGLWLNRETRTIGLIPGVHIGDVFLYRMELCVLGLHGQIQAGIDFVTASQSPSHEPIATSIIVSGGYEDDEDRGDVLVYTGHGGREGKNETRHSLDQKLEDGNLALERSYHYNIEIRVIRGVNCKRSPTGKLYVYDGLYKVVKCWSEMGKSGFIVYKFKLVRYEGQEEMGSALIKLAEELKGLKAKGRANGYLSADISKKKENEPVAVVNNIDGNKDPLLFEYVVRPTFKTFDATGLGGSGCQCASDCNAGCECVKRNGREVAFDCHGRLLRGRPLVYECGKKCGCLPSCMNQMKLKGLRHQLEVFRSRETGWGVRSLDFIQAGEFICEYSGILLTKQEAEQAAKDGALLVYPNLFARRWEEWGDLSMVNPHYVKPAIPPVPDVGYVIDVSRARNVACYLRHSTSPNVFVQFVLTHHCNAEYPRLMIFALENIPPMRELTLDYGVRDG